MDQSEIIGLRPDKNKVDPRKPYHFLHEQEVGPNGEIKEVNTIFLTNSECPFKCVMCDLWKNTLDDPVSEGDVPRQLDFALGRLPDADVVKLYNSGNFFDCKAIPPADYSEIADRLCDYERVIVENHPKLCGDSCREFQQMLEGQLEIALGLETIHPDVLPKLNKQITKENFKDATSYLGDHDIDCRAFILLNPPFLTDPGENIAWTVKSVEYAFECGISACSIIPTRGGNGVMETLAQQGAYIPPTIKALEQAFERSLLLDGGRVFVDLWDLEIFSDCSHCFEPRKNRLSDMNYEQQIFPSVTCNCCTDE